MKKLILIASSTGVIAGGLLTLLFPMGTWWIGWLSSAVLMALAIFILLFPLSSLEAGREGLWLTVAAFATRLVIGLGLMVALPVWGYDNEVQQAGYLFKDAYERDTAVWELADSETSLWQVFDEEFVTDQYGGLAFISALIYRFLSPDAHRPYLVLLVSSFAFAYGVPFFYSAVKQRFDAKLALIASWIIVLYPEGIFYTVSQMREPFMIGGAMVLLWGILRWQEASQRRKILLVCIPTAIVMAVISWLMFGAVLLVLGGWFAIDWIQNKLPAGKKKYGYLTLCLVILFGLAAFAFISREWLRFTIWWDMREMLLTSGHIEIMVQGLPVPVQYAVITVYGVLQMVPPAALIETSAPLWKVISVLRSVGWYLFLPLLLYGGVALWKKDQRKERILLAWLLLFTWGWTIFASLRAGGDSWDNPRYRMLALPIMALLVVWFWRNRGHWLWRIAAIEVFAMAIFTHWYLARYAGWFRMIPLTTMIGVILGVAVLTLASGIWRELRQRKST